VATRFINISIFEIVKELKPSVASGMAMILSVLLIMPLTLNINSFFQLAIVILAGAIGYLVVLWYLERDNLTHLLRKVGVKL
jgi:hypothetical protein